MTIKPALKKVPSGSKPDFAAVFAALKSVLQPYAAQLRAVHDTPAYFYLETKEPAYKGRPLMFAAVRLGKAYVSYHLMPVYMNPGLEKRISPALKRRMQGKSCFNFAYVDQELFAELAALTQAGFEQFRDFCAKEIA